MKQNNSTANISECQDALATTANNAEFGCQAPMGNEPPACVDEPIPDEDGELVSQADTEIFGSQGPVSSAGQEEEPVQEEAPRDTESDTSPAMWTPEEVRAGIKAKRRKRAERREARKAAQSPAPCAGIEVVEDDAVQGTRMPLPPDPPKIWHPRVQELLADAARAVSDIPPQATEAALWALCSGCIGRSRKVWMSNTWTVAANMFFLVVGETGIGKSPVARIFFGPFEAYEHAKRKEYEKIVQNYQDEHAAWEKLKGKDRGDEPKAPKPMPRYSVNDHTPEALVRELSRNPRGVWLRVDEASSLLGGMDRYTGGKETGVTRGILLEAYDGRTIDLVRVDTTRERYAPNATLTLYGHIQPGILPKAFSQDDQALGLLQRIIFCPVVRKGCRKYPGAGLPPASQETLKLITNGLLSLTMVADGNLDDPDWHPQYIYMDDDAHATYQEWWESIAQDEASGAFGDAKAWAPKLQEHALRAVNVLHCVDAVLDNRLPEASPISAATMRRAIEWADWVRAMQMLTLGIMKGEYYQERSPVEQAIMRVFADAGAGKPLVALLSSDITARVNTALKASGQDGYSAETVGKVLLQLGRSIPGLKSVRVTVDGKRGRGWRANGAALARMRQDLAPAEDEEVTA